MNRVEQAVRKSGFFKAGSRVIVGFSGGADSTALLHCLAVRCGVSVIAYHVNHLLRGEESDRDEQAVRLFCRTYHIPLEIQRIDVAAVARREQCGLEEAGRMVRYRFFEKMRQTHQTDWIATAHTLSDQAETLLFRMARGTGGKGLCGIPSRRGYIVRPLLTVSRTDIESYCKQYALPFVTDSSNQDCRYARNQIRNAVLPALAKIEPQAERAIARLASILSEEDAYLSEHTEQAMAEIALDGGYSAQKLLSYPGAIQRRAAIEILQKECGHADYASCEALLHLANMYSGSISVTGSTILSIRRGKIFREEQAVFPPFAVPLSVNKPVNICGMHLCSQIIPQDMYATYQKIYKNLLYLALDYDTIKGKLVIRQKQDGDRFSPAHRKGTRTLKKLFAEAGLTAVQKSAVPVFCDEERIVAVWGFGTECNNAITPKTRRILLIYEDKMGEDKNERGYFESIAVRK